MRSVLPNRTVFEDKDLSNLAGHVKVFSLRNFPGICPDNILLNASMNSYMKVLRFENLNTENSLFIGKLRTELT